VFHNQCCSGEQIEKNEKCRACSKYGGEDRCIQGCGGEKMTERDHFEDSDVDGGIILRQIFRKWDRGTWIGLIWLRIGTGGRHL
jgi:hypothetical protein